MQTVDDKAVISSLRWYASDQYWLLITVGGVGGVGGDFSQIVVNYADCNFVRKSWVPQIVL